MKFIVIVGVLAAAYAYVLLSTTNIVLGQTQHLNATYQYVANNSQKIAAGR